MTVSVLSGTLNFTTNATLGAGTTDILVGNTSGTTGASLLNNAQNWSRNVTVQSGNTGTSAIGSTTAVAGESYPPASSRLH